MNYEQQLYFSFDDERDWKDGVMNTWKVFYGIPDVKFSVYGKFVVDEQIMAAIWSASFPTIQDMINFVERNVKNIVVYFVQGTVLRFAKMRGCPLDHLMEDYTPTTFERGTI